MTAGPVRLRSVRRDDPVQAEPSRVWWREPMVWLVIAGPASVVVASFVSAAVAWQHIDPMITDPVTGAVAGGADDVADYRNPKASDAPAQVGRNHAATPAR